MEAGEWLWMSFTHWQPEPWSVSVRNFGTVFSVASEPSYLLHRAVGFALCGLAVGCGASA